LVGIVTRHPLPATSVKDLPYLEAYCKVRQLVITKCDSYFIAKCDKCYYKVRQVSQSVTVLLQSMTDITKCDDYYKVRLNSNEKINLAFILLISVLLRRKTAFTRKKSTSNEDNSHLL